MKNILSNIKDYMKNTDKLLWFFSFLATAYSVLLILSMQQSGDYNYLKSQIAAVFIGIIGAVALSVVDYRTMIRYWYIPTIIGFLLAASVFVFGFQVAGTDDTAWIRLPGGFTFQPSELMKLCFIITFSAHLAYLIHKDKLKTLVGVLTLFGHALIPIVLIHFQGEDGSALIFMLMFLVMTFMAGVQLRYFAALLGGLAIGIPVIWNFIMNDDQRNRFTALFDIDGNALSNYGYQQYQGKVSIASGKFFGYGLGNGPRVKTGIVPEQENDFILTVAGEELGYIGCIVLFALLLAVMIKVLITGIKSQDRSGSFICYGLFAMIMTQSVVNLGMVIGFLPVIGITLPFFSAGGTSVLCMFLGVGLAQSVYIHNKIEPDDHLRDSSYRNLIKEEDEKNYLQ